ncbi:MAG: hypothetical protein UY90_C0042G0003 [Candidatus Peregrinibacteria bacterium GW2011_GWA2_54_9]|nr:MAG: hypothetical protein UY90_C0042G0003 [Candidatus Peregrinibacteria bacterium GW2011_GWA2_54_9]
MPCLSLRAHSDTLSLILSPHDNDTLPSLCCCCLHLCCHCMPEFCSCTTAIIQRCPSRSSCVCRSRVPEKPEHHRRVQRRNLPAGPESEPRGSTENHYRRTRDTRTTRSNTGYKFQRHPAGCLVPPVCRNRQSERHCRRTAKENLIPWRTPYHESGIHKNASTCSESRSCERV